MSCDAYNLNAGPQVELSGELDEGACFESPQQFFNLIRDTLVGRLPDSFTTAIVSDTEPAPSDRDKLWIAVDPTTCRPLGIRLYYNGDWVDVGAVMFYGVDTSATDNSVLVESTTPVVNALVVGQIFAIKAGRNNSGPVTVTLKQNGVAFGTAIPLVKYGGQPLVGFEFLTNMIIYAIWDGTNLQMLNPRPDSFASGTNRNLSFEEDINGDGVPDQWSLYVSQATFSGVGGDNRVSPAGGSGAMDPTDSVHGGVSFKFNCASLTGNGGGFIQNTQLIECDADSPLEISWWTKSEFANVDNMVEVLWYNAARAHLSTDVLWHNNASNPVGIWRQHGGLAVSDLTAKFFRLRFTAGISGTSAGGAVWFDDVRFTPPSFKHQITYSAPGVNKWRCPPDVHQARLSLVGAGAGGGGSETTGAAGGAPGGGGGAGATAICYQVVVPGTTYTINVGTGGDGGLAPASPTAGGDTTATFENAMTAQGGQGAQNADGSGGTGGSGGFGTINTRTDGMIIGGGDGVDASGAPNRGSDLGVGGSSSLGAGGTPVFAADGQDGYAPGGGGGGSRTSAAPAKFGGDGADGAGIINY